MVSNILVKTNSLLPDKNSSPSQLPIATVVCFIAKLEVIRRPAWRLLGTLLSGAFGPGKSGPRIPQ